MTLYSNFRHERGDATSKLLFLALIQILITWYLAVDKLTGKSFNEDFAPFPEDATIGLTRYFCGLILHVYLSQETRQGLDMMKYAVNHPYKFRKWYVAYLIGLTQFSVLVTVELVNLIVLVSNNSIEDILMNFLALIVLTDFDNFLFITVRKELLAKLLEDGEVETEQGQTIRLDRLVRNEQTCSLRARFRINQNRLRPHQDVED